MATDAAKSRDWIVTLAYLVGFGTVAYLLFTVVGALDAVAKQTAAATTSVTGAASNTVQAGSGIVNGFLSMLGFSQTDPTQIPGYKVGNWQAMMNGPNNPFSAAYVPADNSMINPGPTAITNNYVTPLNNQFSSWFNINTDAVLTTIESMPSRDIVNLTWSYEKILNNIDIAQQIAQYGNPQFQDAVASVILNKPISA